MFAPAWQTATATLTGVCESCMEVSKKHDGCIRAVLGRQSAPVAALTVCVGLVDKRATGWCEDERQS